MRTIADTAAGIMINRVPRKKLILTLRLKEMTAAVWDQAKR